MKFTFNLIAYTGRLPGLGNKDKVTAWARGDSLPDPTLKVEKTLFIPMMQARRLNYGSRLAADCGLELAKTHAPEAVVFCSRHGELERNYSILKAVGTDTDVSPTDFAMSVHNAAVGSFTITGKQKIPASSVSAGIDTFEQALTDAVSMLSEYQKVMLVDFDSALPAFYRESIDSIIPSSPYAVGLVLEKGSAFTVESEVTETNAEPTLAHSLSFLRHLVKQDSDFTTQGDKVRWHFHNGEMR